MRVLILICLFSFSYAHANPFTINIIETYNGHTEQTLLENVFGELYKPLGIIPKLVYYPSKRGLMLVNQGTIDAEAGRFESTIQNYPNLIKVNEPLGVFHSGVYCLDKKNCEIGTNANIVALSSAQSAHGFCESINLKCRSESKPITIARLMEKGVAHGYLSTTTEANKVLCAINSDKIYYKNVSSLARFSYHFVNKRHALLIPKLEQSMRQLKQKGILSTFILGSTPKHWACGKEIIAV